ncbi:hypothetical protein AU210_010082 [Fusarium oxysporum f. sp. radicis-cucumerinum]|uniref:Uncharacterized protein n=1 Tax=Fusarium oxysporum f. sp. radicis-cucumerinum TaxID=327505 RepID=A0A2H3GKL4_FUSOX|nr:hypothetical protein AU210_010082 [Fusarium oxysporum f. sp. radicis-cucumerinum]
MSAPRFNKRHASSAHENEPINKKGRPSKSELAANTAQNPINRIEARKMLSEAPPLRCTDDDLNEYYRQCVSWTVDVQWGPEDDDAIAGEWDRSAQKANSMMFDSAQHASLLALFKACLRLFQTTPIAILSPYYGLRYQPVSHNQGNKWVYSKLFCDELTALLVHPFWEGNTDLLATALGWTVICRLDDRRLWEGRLDMPWTALHSVFKQVDHCRERGQDLPSSYHDMHKLEREFVSERCELPGEWSDLFFEIGELASQETAAEPEGEFLGLLGLPVLPVTIYDLRLLTVALNSTELRPGWNYSVNEALQGWNAELSGQELPGIKELPLIFEIAWKSVLRHVRLLKQINGSESSSLSIDDEGDDDMTDSLDAGANFDSGEFLPQATNGSEELRPCRPALAELLPLRPPTLPIYTSVREQKILPELLELRKGNRKLQEGQKELEELFDMGAKRQNEVIAQTRNLILQGQKEQKELMLNMQKQLDSMQSDLSELRQAKVASNRVDNKKRHPERPSLEATVTASDSAPKSPESGTNSSAPHNDAHRLKG